MNSLPPRHERSEFRDDPAEGPRSRKHGGDVMRQAFRIFFAALAAAASVIGAPDAKADSSALDLRGWNVPAPGTPAFIGTNGDHAASAIVCKSLAAFDARERRISGHPRRCVKVKSGTVAIINGIKYDPASVSAGGDQWTIAEIYIPSQKLDGFVTLAKALVPIIPPGKVIHVRSAGDGFRLAKAQEDFSGVGRKFTRARIEILRQDGAVGENGRDLYVAIDDNGHVKKGWLESFSLTDETGQLINRFKYSTTDLTQKIPKPFLLTGSPQNLAKALANQTDVSPFHVPRGDPDFAKYTDYYAAADYSAAAAVRCGFRGHNWEERVLTEELDLLKLRSLYDYPLSATAAKRAVVSAKLQLQSSTKAGLQAPYSICANLRNSRGFLLAQSMTSLLRK